MKGMYIDGQFVSGNGNRIEEILNPVTLAVIDSVPIGTERDASAASEAAAHANRDWRWIPGLERAEMLHEAAQKIRTHYHDIAKFLTLEEGKPLPENEEEVEWLIGTLDYYAEVARVYRGRLLAPGELSQFNFVLKEPYGSVACIIPFN